MTARLGKHQLALLAAMGNPGMIALTAGKVARSLARRGLLQAYGRSSSALQISPAGLRALADAHGAGLLQQFMREVPK